MLNDKIIKICEEKFIYLNYSSETKDTYLSYIKQFINHIGNKQAIHLNSNNFQNYLDTCNFTSISQQNQIVEAVMCNGVFYIT